MKLVLAAAAALMLIAAPAVAGGGEADTAQYEILDHAHPNWRETVKSESYSAWAMNQPEWVKKIIRENGTVLVDGAAAALVFSRYNQYLAASRPQTSGRSKWLRLTSSQSGSVVYIDASKDPGGATPKIWVMFDQSKNASTKEREVKELWKFHCDSERVAVLSSVGYSPTGTVVHSRSKADYDFNYDPVVPDTIAARVMREACGN